MAEVIDTAGLSQGPVSLRREAIKAIRAQLRKPDLTDDQYEDALESLIELANLKE